MRRELERFILFFNEIGAWMFFVIMLLITVEVIARYFFRSSVPGVIEMVQIMQVLGVGLCAAYAQRNRANVNVDLLINMASIRTRNVVNVLTAFLSLVIFALMTYAIFRISSTPGAMRETTDTLRIPLYPIKWVLGLGFGLVTLQLLAQFLSAIADLINGHDSKEDSDLHMETIAGGSHE